MISQVCTGLCECVRVISDCLQLASLLAAGTVGGSRIQRSTCYICQAAKISVGVPRMQQLEAGRWRVSALP